MTNSTNVLAHTSPRCPVCRVPYADLLEAPTDTDAVDHLVSHGPRAVAFTLLVVDGHRLLAEGAAEAVRDQVLRVGRHLDEVADEQRPAVVGGEGF